MSPSAAIVAIDGPSGVGKSTVAKAVAARLGLPYLETGAMYRAVGWEILQGGIDPKDQDSVEAVATTLDIVLRPDDEGGAEILLDGRELSAEVRLPEVSEITSQTSSYPGVRRRMVAVQRRFAVSRGAVMEGRDIGTRVFPDTPYKFFLTAPLAVRVERRIRQLQHAGGNDLSAGAIEAEVATRDQRDSQRKESPLMLDDSYTVIDTSELSVDETVNLIVEIVERFRSSRGDGC